jgi:class 3 adenylate cyclase/tetratricopeptide (TPR) repeat protein
MREERRIVTALFADLCGSTALTEQLDPEDAREILGAAVAQVIAQVDALGGTVKDLAGDGVLALFGAPTAHEDDVERAVLCGLRIVSAVSATASQVAREWGIDGFGVRVGIETGRAVLGSVGGGSRIEYGATGDAVNTAARLQALADPGTVLVGAVSRTVVEARFDWESAQDYSLKGKQRPVSASTVLSYSPRSAVPAGDVGLVGRQDEATTVADRVSGLLAGHGSVLCIVGDAGLGKTRLVAEARARLPGSGTWLDAAGASFAASVPYGVYRSALLEWLRIPGEASADEVAVEVDARASRESPELAELLRALLPLLTGRLADREHSAEEQRRVFVLLRDLVETLTTATPVLLVLEDLHWSDPTSLAVTEMLLPLADRRPLLVVATMRPDPSGAAALRRLVSAAPDADVVELRPLARTDAQVLMHQLLGAAHVGTALERRLLDSTDGNPFFLEEQLRALDEAGALRPSADSGGSLGAPADVVLAPTVERALLARIDRLPDASRRVVVAAAVLGPRFDERLLTAVAQSDVRDDLPVLVGADLFVADTTRDGARAGYRFRHALVQEAAYASLLRRERRELHGRAAAALAEVYAGREREIAARLGHHLVEAGRPEEGVVHLAVAARDAARTYANEEAVQLAGWAAGLLLEGLIDGDDGSRRLAVEMLRIEGAAEASLARYRAAITAYGRALGLLTQDETLEAVRDRATIGQLLCDEHRFDEALDELDAAAATFGDGPRTRAEFEVWLAVLLAKNSTLYWLADHERQLDVLRRAEPVVEQFATPDELIDIKDSVRSAWLRRDRYVVSDEMAELDQQVYDARRDSPDDTTRGWAMFMHGFTLLWRGELDRARHHLGEALVVADRIGSALLRSRVLTYLAVTARLDGDTRTAADLVGRVREAAEEAGLVEYGATADAIDAWLAWRAGDGEEAHRLASTALTTWESLPVAYPARWMALLPLLDLALAGDDRAEALRLAGQLVRGQHALPAQVTDPLVTGCAAAPTDWPSAAADLRRALEQATALGYL